MLLRDLAWLVALADYRHVTDTAAVLKVPQPTLSRALARVESELGARLFERVPHGVRANPNGDLVVTAAREIIARYQRMVAELESRLDPDTGTVRLAFLDSMATSLVPRLLRAFHQHAPKIKVLLTQEPAHEILRDLETGAAELAITSSRPGPNHGWLALQQDRLILVVPPTHRLRARRRIGLEELAGEELVTTPVGFGFRTQLDKLLTEAGVSPTVSFESADFATIEGLVAAGLGVALVPEQFAGLSGTIGIALNTPAARRTVGLTWRSDRDLAPAATRLLDFIKSTPNPTQPRSGLV
ncbi:transcriptional regulator, LysR family protein [Alloactinosynnema sp. L-07]|uniref:LysR family transcriptional regulator n=1 Tax=Alloactinosynnema sp. L-07 TaxID=1653480 RepID=UPI00065F0551|nr:LysR family transcriptional regulator [Alloactinosynnema sp. L-07]CRK56104.1 transcriptional regulator, LysR family protein [Alloactinosynnema sp. L-07]